MKDRSEITPVDNGPIIEWYEPSCLRCLGTVRDNHCVNCGQPAFTPKEHQQEPECCCSVEDGGTYCGQPECDIYYCHDCGDEFSEPCIRHEGVDHA
jgi:hypothetical protein